MFIGSHVKAARERRGLTQKQLAEAVGVAEGTVTLWENKRNHRPISQEHLQKVADVLDMPVSLLTGSPLDPQAMIITKMRPLTVSPEEKALVMLFRSFSKELQLLQLAQFVECAHLSQAEQLAREAGTEEANPRASVESHPS